MKNKKLFKWIYLGFAALTALGMLAAILYVRGLLVDYEAARPERQAERAIELLAQETKEESYWQKFDLPQVDEEIKTAFLKLCQSEGLSYIAQSASAEDEMEYLIRKGTFPLAKVTLKAQGPQVTKLAVFTMREWAIEGIVPLFEKRTYTATLPEGFRLWADGKELNVKAEGENRFALEGVYLEPQFKVVAADGTEVGYEIKNFKVIPEIFEYSLTLPATVQVKMNGKELQGAVLPGGRVRYEIMELKQPEILLSDLYGNEITYKDDLPMTYLSLKAPADYTVLLEGKAVAEQAVKAEIAEEYVLLENLVHELPTLIHYEIAILKDDAAIKVTDGQGKEVALEQGATELDLTAPLPKQDTVPQAIADEIDVLKVAQHWSLFMSNDRTFTEMAKEMDPDSYQYEVAKKYSTSIDKQFFASHTLLSPAFTENKVSNFTQITPDAFSVEVSFVKHMRLNNGGKVVKDAMNDCFYFVRNADGWRLAALKEVA
ncbi:MAG: hypothetical protein IJ995_05155 [Clostridia bacterium]|nr:hypothetical protein [Clostridia bacterium]